MTREFITHDLGELGFSDFYIFKEEKWKWVDLEVDCDEITLANFRNDSTLNFQFWMSDDNTYLNLASNVMGHKRQAQIPIAMVKSLKLAITSPAKGGAEFNLSIESALYRGELISGSINVEHHDKQGWDLNEFKSKSKTLEQKTESLLRMTGGIIVKRENFINA